MISKLGVGNFEISKTEGVLDNSILMGNLECFELRDDDFINDQASRPISTGQLNVLLRLHILPINVVVFHGSLGSCDREI